MRSKATETRRVVYDIEVRIAGLSWRDEDEAREQFSRLLALCHLPGLEDLPEGTSVDLALARRLVDRLTIDAHFVRMRRWSTPVLRKQSRDYEKVAGAAIDLRGRLPDGRGEVSKYDAQLILRFLQAGSPDLGLSADPTPYLELVDALDRLIRAMTAPPSPFPPSHAAPDKDQATRDHAALGLYSELFEDILIKLAGSCPDYFIDLAPDETMLHSHTVPLAEWSLEDREILLRALRGRVQTKRREFVRQCMDIRGYESERLGPEMNRKTLNKHIGSPLARYGERLWERVLRSSPEPP